MNDGYDEFRAYVRRERWKDVGKLAGGLAIWSVILVLAFLTVASF
jgi:hypothetical protein